MCFVTVNRGTAVIDPSGFNNMLTFAFYKRNVHLLIYLIGMKILKAAKDSNWCSGCSLGALALQICLIKTFSSSYPINAGSSPANHLDIFLARVKSWRSLSLEGFSFVASAVMDCGKVEGEKKVFTVTYAVLFSVLQMPSTVRRVGGQSAGSVVIQHRWSSWTWQHRVAVLKPELKTFCLLGQSLFLPLHKETPASCYCTTFPDVWKTTWQIS